MNLQQCQQDQFEIAADFMAQGRQQLAKVKVKNTFIDVADSDDDDYDARPRMEARKTCPGSTTTRADTEHSDLDDNSWRSETVSFEEKSQTAGVAIEAVNEGIVDSRHPGPCLLLQQGRQNFKVKNTFIDGVESGDDDDEDLPPMVPTKSCPLRARSQMWPPTPLQASPATGEDPVQLEPALEAIPSPVITPLEQRKPELSKGGQLHGSGKCKPCAWFWRPQGCVNSQECLHCHLCTAAELKIRKKAKRAAQKHPSGSESPENHLEVQPMPNSMHLPAVMQLPVIPGLV